MSPVIRIESFPERNGPQIAGVISRYTGMYGVDELLGNLPAEFEVAAETFEALRTELDQLGCNRQDVISPDPVVVDPRLRPQYKLYSLAAIDLATFFGSALAGAFLLTGNFRRLGNSDSARNVLFLGLAVFFGFALVLVSTPSRNYQAQGKPAEAEPLLKRALAIHEKALGPDHPTVGTSLNNLADVYRAQGKYAEAELLYKRALAVQEKALGPEHPNVATLLESMAMIYVETGRQDEGKRLWKRAKAIRSKNQ